MHFGEHSHPAIVTECLQGARFFYRHWGPKGGKTVPIIVMLTF